MVQENTIFLCMVVSSVALRNRARSDRSDSFLVGDGRASVITPFDGFQPSFWPLSLFPFVLFLLPMALVMKLVAAIAYFYAPRQRLG